MSPRIDAPATSATDAAFSPAELDRRRRAARRLAWGLGLVALLIYGGGLFVAR